MKLKVFLLVVSISVLVGYEGVQPPSFFHPYPTPWFTGTLIAPSGFVAKPGRMNIQPYISSFVKMGVYDSGWKRQSKPNLYTLSLFTQIKVGLFPRAIA